MVVDQGRDYAIRVLQRLGLEVEAIPEGSSKTADIRAAHSGDHYLIECKQKHHDLDEEKRTLEKIVKGEVVLHSETQDGKNSIAKRIYEAAKQIESSADDEETFRYIWIEVTGLDKDLRWQQVVHTFYGATYATTYQDNTLFTAFYVAKSAAFRHPSIDGLLLIDRSGLCLLLNEFSPRYERIKLTALCRQIGAGVLDPRVHIREGYAIALDGDADRSSEKSIEAALTAQMGTKVGLIPMTQYSATSFLPNKLRHGKGREE
ncbi:hypothetical protein [Botrimarina mediterranea]|uniref:Uncharacterized protein n=1 Tax=Botrimarina mediterranea TaxID=2528022 RepID=A0A518K6G0_9BACT|nr:hypothetical protein [Botrimarina mediterranea]QDV73383.1 hypothetical protein Spa11_15790 [Botrimarina mediterranea]QDV77900.1 hypothetical protein K2D_15050 [Planctomycetes bacterium K2D]